MVGVLDGNLSVGFEECHGFCLGGEMTDAWTSLLYAVSGLKLTVEEVVLSSVVFVQHT